MIVGLTTVRQAEKAAGPVREAVNALLVPKPGREPGEEPARILIEGAWTHAHPITFDRRTR